MARSFFSSSATLLALLVLGTSGCMRARLLNPVANTAPHERTTGDSAPGVIGAGGGTLRGTGVTLQANFSMAGGAPLKGHGVQLQTGP